MLSLVRNLLWVPLIALGVLSAPALSQDMRGELPDEIRGVDVVDRLGSRMPRPIMIRTSEGEAVDLAQYFDGEKPVALLLVYYDCPLICPKILQDMGEVFGSCKFEPGRDYRVVVVSFDPENTDEMAADAKRDMMDVYRFAGDRELGPEVEAGFAFHTASGGNAQKIADAVGFKYKKLRNGEYSHPSVLIVMSPDGVVTRYLKAMTSHQIGGGKDTEQMGRDLRVALLEASDGKIARSFADWFIHKCFSFDADSGTYTRDAMAIMRLGGGVTLVVLVGGIGVLLLGERSRRKFAARKREQDPIIRENAEDETFHGPASQGAVASREGAA